jgi:hypothetical protein
MIFGGVLIRRVTWFVVRIAHYLLGRGLIARHTVENLGVWLKLTK